MVIFLQMWFQFSSQMHKFIDFLFIWNSDQFEEIRVHIYSTEWSRFICRIYIQFNLCGWEIENPF